MTKAVRVDACPHEESILTVSTSAECPYGAEGCPKVDELKTELQNIRKENNVIWKELNKVDEMVASNSSSLSGLKRLVFILICGATGVSVIV